MRNKRWIGIFIVILIALTACGTEDEPNDNKSETDELKTLDVNFEVPETANVDETVKLKATVTYGGEKVKDADTVEFEYWEKGKEDDSTKIEAKNNDDGTYTAEVAFDRNGVFELYAHVTAKSLHTMPKKSITVGNGESTKQEKGHHDTEEDHKHGAHVEGFSIHFMNPERVKAGEETEMTVHLQMDNEPFENANVRYEIVNGSNAEKHEWVETRESASGEYTTTHSFSEEGTYTITVHVENDEGLHEHQEYQIEVNN